MLEVIKDIFTNIDFLSAIIITIVFIFLGFILRYTKVLGEGSKKVLIAILMNVALPVTSFIAFMSDFDPSGFADHIMVFIMALMFFVIFIALGNLVFLKKEKNTRKTYAILLSVGQVTFFAIPILKVIFSSDVSNLMIEANMLTLAFRLVLYIYCYFVISRSQLSAKEFGKTMKTIFLNPIIIAMLLGMLLWLIQNVVAKVNIDGVDYAFFRIDKTVPVLFNLLKAIDALTTPLAMMVIGIVIAESSIKNSFKNIYAWIISAARSFLVPLASLGLCLLLNLLPFIHLNIYSLSVLVICFGAPVSTVVNVFCAKYDNEKEVASSCCLISTILSIASLPLLYVLVSYCEPLL